MNGMLEQAEGRHDAALALLRRAHDEIGAFKNPMIGAMQAEVRAYMALSLKAQGKLAEAELLWQPVLPQLCRFKYQLLMERYAHLPG